MRMGVGRIAMFVLLPMVAIAAYVIESGRINLPGDNTTADIAPAAALAQYLRSQPQDERAWVLLARALAVDEHYGEAAEAFARALAFSKVGRDASVWAEYADALGMAQGGTLAGKPEELIGKALALDAHNRRALDLAGSAAYERGDFATAGVHWRALLAQLPAGSAQSRELTAAIARTERLARTRLPASTDATRARGNG